jgi:hypothetical protein
LNQLAINNVKYPGSVKLIAGQSVQWSGWLPITNSTHHNNNLSIFFCDFNSFEIFTYVVSNVWWP